MMLSSPIAPIALTDVVPLTESELDRLTAIKNGWKALAQPAALRAREVFKAQRAKEGRSMSVTWSDAGAVERLHAEHEVLLDSGEWVTVGTLLREPAKYHGRKCYDPLEPGYGGGRVVAVVYSQDETGAPRQPVIHSKAHGGCNYVLHADVADEFAVASVAMPPTNAVDETPTPLRALIEQYNLRYAYVRSLDAILFTPNAQTWELLTMAAFRNYTRPDRVFDGHRSTTAAEAWLSNKSRRTVSRTVFEPAKPPLADIPSPNGDPEPAFNTWPGLAIAPSTDGSDELFVEHLRRVVANDDADAFSWIMEWLAAMVQKPAEVPGTALVLRGVQGAGKDTVGEVMRAILGPSLHTTIADPEQLTGRFNAPHEGKVLLQVEEGFFAGNRGDRGKLKHLITAPSVSIERKGIDRYEVRNCARPLITSNENWVVPAESGERRFMVLNVSGDRANDLAYHSALRKQMFADGGCARFLHRLLNETVVDWARIRRPLATDALRDQQIETLDPERSWLFDVLLDGELPGDAGGEGIVEKESLFRSYVGARGDRRGTKTRLTRFLKTYGVTETKMSAGGLRRRAYQFPSLAKCRAQFAREFAAPIDWNDQSHWASDPLLTGGAIPNAPVSAPARRMAVVS